MLLGCGNQSVAHPRANAANNSTSRDARDFSRGPWGGATGPDDGIAAEYFQNIGATIMGRHMFGGGDGPWGEKPWNGWW